MTYEASALKSILKAGMIKCPLMLSNLKLFLFPARSVYQCHDFSFLNRAILFQFKAPAKPNGCNTCSQFKIY